MIICFVKFIDNSFLFFHSKECRGSKKKMFIAFSVLIDSLLKGKSN